MFTVAINKYQLAIDKISFYITMYNFAIVGVAAVFYQKGIPSFINQSYLVATWPGNYRISTIGWRGRF